MHGENLLVNDGGNGEAVEAVGEGLPELDVVSALALIVESINTVDRGALVVTAENEEVFGVLDLVGKEQADSLEGLLATVDVVTEEQVVGLRGETTVFEQTEEIVVLTVDITTDLKTNTDASEKKRGPKKDKHPGEVRETWNVRGDTTYLDGGLQLQKNRLRDKDFTGLGAKVSDFGLQQLNLLAWTAAPHLQQAINDGVQIHFLVGHLERPLRGKEKKNERRKRTGRKEKRKRHARGKG